jgi:hypothetical protein
MGRDEGRMGREESGIGREDSGEGRRGRAKRRAHGEAAATRCRSIARGRRATGASRSGTQFLTNSEGAGSESSTA